MIESVVDTFGPFLIPVVIFGIGLVGYLILFVLTRRGILGGE
ncbi:MAG: hypothetical protein V5A32_09550 [Halovenus sp.]